MSKYVKCPSCGGTGIQRGACSDLINHEALSGYGSRSNFSCPQCDGGGVVEIESIVVFQAVGSDTDSAGEQA